MERRTDGDADGRVCVVTELRESMRNNLILYRLHYWERTINKGKLERRNALMEMLKGEYVLQLSLGSLYE